jgi:hypothetical protein
MDGFLIGQIVGDKVRFAPIHLKASNPAFFIKLKSVIDCFSFIIATNKD